MKILLVHKFLRMTGGTEQYFRNLTAILKDHGHRTIPFALEHPDNPDTPYARYFLKDLDYREPSKLYRLRNAPRMIGRTLYSCEARRHIEALIRDTKPDIAHLQSIEHHISPSILHSLRKYGIPAVQSINTYKLVCASYRLYLLDRAEICERCLYGKHYQAALTRCVKGSLPASLLAMIEMYLHEWLRIYHLVDRFIVSNRFMEAKLLEAGHPAEKIVRLLNPLDLAQYTPCYELGDHILYFGRIDPEKGVTTLVQAMRRLPRLKLVVVGDGSQFEQVREWVRDNQADNVELVGAKWGDELAPYLSKARLVVVPSIWWENAPLVIQEAFQHRRPVIASGIGGMAEMVKDGVNGLHALPDDPLDLARVMRRAAEEPGLQRRLVQGIGQPRDIDQCAREHLELFATARTSPFGPIGDVA